ncbi:unnamed protein product [Rotaria socialis]|uniref:Uncharacterized protein n=1 Tax=Rotaria socialis TaxID=392032 RepID=A0A817N8Z4_9BILA|nr:unnamed protein product [Rotaria socialis]CAF3200440.1 unnamed protein product [Rotaria socialis]CAF3321859.1 unnamed protein product [Rotaria socialis]CAF3638630.1 unnamed protein product [Rotaria socialis]CAF3714009.1 unnamed protein product [Rotaria socialis]
MDTKEKSSTNADHTSVEQQHSSHGRIVQNFLLVWLDSSIDPDGNEDCKHIISKLKEIIYKFDAFTDVDTCLNYIGKVIHEKIFFITSGAFAQTIVPRVHGMSQINTIYIFCGNKTRHEEWIKQWPKVKGVFTRTARLCETLQQAVQQCDQDATPISMFETNDVNRKLNLNELDSSFMYTQIMKEILLTIPFEQRHANEFLNYCREIFANNPEELKFVEQLEEKYQKEFPIFWYTCNCFLYGMLNRSLRTMEIDLIIRMGFFIRDLHGAIFKLHRKQYVEQANMTSFTTFRGQGLSKTDFDKMFKTQGGLLSFNNFLSTSKNREISLEFAQSAIETPDVIGILFSMKIDPSIPSTPFANISTVSYYKKEAEILFSMHSIFRIGAIDKINGNSRLWQVDLTLTSDNDPDLQSLTEHIRKETYPQLEGWDRLGKLLIKLGKFDKAEDVYDILLLQTKSDREKSHLYHMFGIVKDGQGQYANVIAYYERAIEINEKILSPQDVDLAASYGCIGLAYNKIDDYSNALLFHQKALKIYQQSPPANRSHVAVSFNNIGSVYNSMGDYSNALLYYQKAVTIKEDILPSHHPSLATSYNNIGLVYSAMGDYSAALSSHRKALEIQEKSLPPDHSDFAPTYGHMGMVYSKIEEYPKAVSYCERALEILTNSLSENHPRIQLYKNNLESVKKKV